MTLPFEAIPRFPSRIFAVAASVSLLLHAAWLMTNATIVAPINLQGGALEAVAVSLTHLTIVERSDHEATSQKRKRQLPAAVPTPLAAETVQEQMDDTPVSPKAVVTTPPPEETTATTRENKLVADVNTANDAPQKLASEAPPTSDVQPSKSRPPVRKNPSFTRPPSPPRYPAIAIKRRWQGQALIHALINDQGRPAELVLKQSSGFDVLDRSALDAVGRWHFEPTFEGGRKIVSWVEIPVEFNLTR